MQYSGDKFPEVIKTQVAEEDSANWKKGDEIALIEDDYGVGWVPVVDHAPLRDAASDEKNSDIAETTDKNI